MNLTTALARLLIFPGLLFAVPAAWFFLWVERKAVARMQGRIGPPFMQPFFDFIKLLGKDTPRRQGIAGSLMKFWPSATLSFSESACAISKSLSSVAGPLCSCRTAWPRWRRFARTAFGWTTARYAIWEKRR